MMDFFVFPILSNIGCQICYLGGIPSPSIDPGFFVLASITGIIAIGLVLVKTVRNSEYKKLSQDKENSIIQTKSPNKKNE